MLQFTRRITLKRGSKQNIKVTMWPAKSSNLNSVENLWGVLERQIYANARQFCLYKS